VQQSALYIVHATAQGNLEQFAEHQHQREQEVGQALIENYATLYNQVHELARSQDAQGNAIRADIEGRQNDIHRSELDETSAMVAKQANETKLIEMRLLEESTQPLRCDRTRESSLGGMYRSRDSRCC